MDPITGHRRILIPYLCYRCGFSTEYKKTMSDHLYKRKKKCVPRMNDVELTEEIKATIMECRVYRPDGEQKPFQLSPLPPRQLPIPVPAKTPLVVTEQKPVAPREPPTYIRVNINLGKDGTKTTAVQRRPICKLLRTLVWNSYIGEQFGVAKCVCCKQNDIRQSSFHCGHVVSVSEGGDNTIDNLRPICDICNHSMGTRNMEDFMEDYGLGPLPTKISQSAADIKRPREPEEQQEDQKLVALRLSKTLLDIAKGADHARIEKLMLDFISENEVGEVNRINVYELIREMSEPTCREFTLYKRLLKWDPEDPSTKILIDYMKTL